MNTLDITSFKQRGDALVDAVAEAVKDTQLYIVRPYPDIILMTPEQFEMLKPAPDAVPKAQHLFRTPHNMMEVHVKGVYEGLNVLNLA